MVKRTPFNVTSYVHGLSFCMHTDDVNGSESSWNVMAHGEVRQGKWRGNWRMEWVASTLHTTSEHGVSSITTADAHTSAASSRLNWCPRRFKWTRPFRRRTKSDFCACAITFQTQSTTVYISVAVIYLKAICNTHIAHWLLYWHNSKIAIWS
jgi:hypothetical protein